MRGFKIKLTKKNDKNTWTFDYNDKFGEGWLIIEKWDDGTYTSSSDSGYCGSGFKSIEDAKEGYAKFQKRYRNSIT